MKGSDANLAGSLRRSILEDAIWVVPVFAYAGLYELLRGRYGLDPSPMAMGLLDEPETYAGVVAAVAIVLLQRVRPRLLRLPAHSGERGPPEAFPGQTLGADPEADDRRLWGAVWAWTGWSLLMAAFIAFKGSIPDFQPFSWDVRFMEWDRLLHGGTEPWRLLHPVLGRPVVTKLLDAAYYAWFPLGMGMVLWQSVTRARALRMRFFLSYVICWILLGTVMATVFSSAGPVYFERVTGFAGPYDDLFRYLELVDGRFGLVALDVQAHLWSGYAEGGDAIIRGISAMPSLHVAMPVLYALTLRERSRWLAGASVLYTVLILVGSVHLGWHYAIDGYVTLVMVPVVWWAVGKVVCRYRRLIERAG